MDLGADVSNTKTSNLEIDTEGRDHNWTSPTSKTVLIPGVTTDITKPLWHLSVGANSKTYKVILSH